MRIRPLTPADACADAVRTQSGWVATDEADAVEGFLTGTNVLTLTESEPEKGDDTYAGTRDFYRKAGFRDVREYRPDGWEQSAPFLVGPLG